VDRVGFLHVVGLMGLIEQN